VKESQNGTKHQKGPQVQTLPGERNLALEYYAISQSNHPSPGQEVVIRSLRNFFFIFPLLIKPNFSIKNEH